MVQKDPRRDKHSSRQKFIDKSESKKKKSPELPSNEYKYEAEGSEDTPRQPVDVFEYPPAPLPMSPRVSSARPKDESFRHAEEKLKSVPLFKLLRIDQRYGISV